MAELDRSEQNNNKWNNKPNRPTLNEMAIAWEKITKWRRTDRID